MSFQPGGPGGPGRPQRDVAVTTARDVQLVARSFSLEALKILVTVQPKGAGAYSRQGCRSGADEGLQPIDVTISRVLAKKLAECSIEELRAIEAYLIDVTPSAENASATGS
jgi:hypothetical protein